MEQFGYGQYVNPLTGSPGDDFDALEKGTQQRKISDHMRRTLIFDDNPEGHSGENSEKKEKEKDKENKRFCNKVTGVGTIG